jgi:Kdo2-lipid IVA lauroyltransferase/acyltransferase
MTVIRLVAALRHGRLRARQFLEAVGAIIAFALLRALPVAWASALGGAVLRAVGPRLSVSRRARRNIALAFPEMDGAAHDAILTQAWDNLGRTSAEYPHLAQILRRRVEVSGAEHVLSLRDDGEPGICITAHCANWEIVRLSVERIGLTTTTVYRRPNNPFVDALIRRTRRADEGRLVPKGPAGAKALLATLRQGGHLGLVIDQKMNDGLPAPFFGRPAMTATAAAELALRYDCPVLPVHAERLPGARFRLVVEPPFRVVKRASDAPSNTSEDRRQALIDGMTQMNAVVESWVRARPGEWLWQHKRWMD